MAGKQKADYALSTAEAHPNIALIKYWGKTDEELIIPVTGSLSVTVGAFKTRTSVVPDGELKADRIELDGKELSATEADRVRDLLTHIRNIAGATDFANVVSSNTVPTAAGLASSASGFAALAVAGARAYGLDPSPTQLSRLARRGSGSASRSIFGGFAKWNAGHDDETSYAEELAWAGDPVGMILGIISRDRKSLSSRKAMLITKDTSPYYDSWIVSNSNNLAKAEAAVFEGDYAALGELTELSTMQMHALMHASNPIVNYLEPESWALFNQVRSGRADGLELYATADAGPNVKILVKESQAAEGIQYLRDRFPQHDFIYSALGGGARTVDGE